MMKQSKWLNGDMLTEHQKTTNKTMISPTTGIDGDAPMKEDNKFVNQLSFSFIKQYRMPHGVIPFKVCWKKLCGLHFVIRFAYMISIAMFFLMIRNSRLYLQHSLLIGNASILFHFVLVYMSTFC